MDYRFLRHYTIPQRHQLYVNPCNLTELTRSKNYRTPSSTLQKPPPPPTSLTGDEDVDFHNASPSTKQTYSTNVNRFIPPGKHGTNYVVSQSRPLKRKRQPESETITEATADGNLVIFQGRDASYPDELNRSIHPLKCDLCPMQMNSLQSAKDHYESKAHDRNISQWLAQHYTNKGLEPPEVKRFYKAGPSGPDAFHCEACDLKLTSLTHAKQHYSGRKHRLVINNISKPSGSGHYNADGKWVRTATKATPIVPNDGRFGIGEQFVHPQVTANSSETKANVNGKTAPDTTTTVDGKTETTTTALNLLPDAALYCSLCNISVTAAAHMPMHLEGVKHRRKLKLQNESTSTTVAAMIQSTVNAKSIATSLNENAESVGKTIDFSLYRTPNGSYYCSTCNVTMCHESALQQHLLGKKHIRKAAEEKSKEASTTTTSTTTTTTK